MKSFMIVVLWVVCLPWFAWAGEGPAGLPAGAELCLGNRKFQHPPGTKGFSFSPDNKLVASAGYDKTVRIWEIETGALKQSLQHGGMVYAVAFSPDGKHLASASWDGQARLWDWASGKVVRRFSHGKQALAVAFNADGKLLATSGANRETLVSEVESGKVLHRIKQPGDEKSPSSIESLAFSPDGRWLSGSGAWVFNLKEGKIETLLHTGAGNDRAVAFSPDSKRLASVFQDRSHHHTAIRIWSVPDGKLEHSIADAFGMSVRDLAFTPDGKTLAASGADSRGGFVIRLLKLPEQEWLYSIRNASLPMALSPDGKMLAGGFRSVMLWETATGKSLTPGLMGRVAVVSWSDDGRRIATVDVNNMLRVWNSSKGTLLCELDAGDSIEAVDFPDNTTARAWRQQRIMNGLEVRKRQFEIETGKPQGEWAIAEELRFPQLPINHRLVHINSNVKGMAAPLPPDQAVVWDSATGQVLGAVKLTVFSSGNNRFGHLRLSPDNKLLAQKVFVVNERDRSRSRGANVVVVYDVATGKQLCRVEALKTHVAPFTTAFSPDNRLLATGTFDGKVRLWSLPSGKLLHTYTGHANTMTVSSLAFSPDGKRLVSGSWDGTCIVWLVPSADQ